LGIAARSKARGISMVSYTIATLTVSKAAYDEIAILLRAAGYDHVFMTDDTIDMTGIGLQRVDKEAAKK
jgi:hypothetical protein